MTSNKIRAALNKAAASNPDDMSAVHIMHRDQIKEKNLKKYSTFLSDEQMKFLIQKHAPLSSSAKIREAVIFYQRHHDKI